MRDSRDETTRLCARYSRFPTRVVRVGDVAIGGAEPIVIQSMTISNTLDVVSTVREIEGLVRAGCPLVRVTCPSVREADALEDIKKSLREKRISVPLIADIHFTPNAALRAADFAEKVRINPGNYVDRKKFAVFEISDAEYRAELERIHDRFKPLVLKLKENGVALRIGSNHGSLSDRIMNRYGDTPEGMVESALEFVRICREYDFHDIVLSMKSSVARVAIEAYRLLVLRMSEEGMDYPIHLGVTEAGAGAPARIKSAVGIGGLLAEGIGDTIRVSLTEPSINEIEACREVLVGVARAEPAFAPYLPTGLRQRLGHIPKQPTPREGNHHSPMRPVVFGDRGITDVLELHPVPVGGTNPLRVHYRFGAAFGDPERLSELKTEQDIEEKPEAYWIAVPRTEEAATPNPGGMPYPVPWVFEIAARDVAGLGRISPAISGICLDLAEAPTAGNAPAEAARHGWNLFWRMGSGDDVDSLAWKLVSTCRAALVHLPAVGVVIDGWDLRAKAWTVTRALEAAGLQDRVVMVLEPPGNVTERALIAGPTLLETPAQVLLTGPDPKATSPVEDAYAILQGCRLRLTQAEFISCPSCGRTQFDLETTTERVRKRTGHLKGVKIAVMGCIVNGPGEMADADFGYVGSGFQKVDLYRKHERVRKNLSPDEADRALVELIKESGRWVDPPASG